MECQDAARTHRLSRRSALQVGTGMFGLTLPGLLAARQAQAAAGRGPTKDVSCIFLFLAGGASHFETFDPKPDAVEGIRSLWYPAATSVPGTFITEKMPLTARLMHKVALVRSWQGIDGRHDGGSQHALTGFPTGPESSTTRQYWPNFGCMISALYGSKVPGVPAHVGLPFAGRYTSPPGYLGAAYADFRVKGDPTQEGFQISEEMRITPDRFDERRTLLDQIENLQRMGESATGGLSLHDQFHREAFDTLTTGKLKKAAQLDEEPLPLREAYGMNVHGQRVLLARRMIEAGARFVTVNQAVQPPKNPLGIGGSWDNHGDLFKKMLDQDGAIGNVPQLDMSLSALLTDLDQRGMLDSTLVVVMGEFGRTPKINGNGGRDHYPRAGSVLLAGAGIQGGLVVGATDRNGTEPATVPYTPADFAATIYHALGIDSHRTYFPKLTRPTPIADGNVIEELFG